MRTFRPARLAMILACAGCGMAAVAPASPVIIEESQRLVSPDPQFPFNGRVAMHGNTLVVASIIQDNNGDYVVSVFIYERSTASDPWRFARKLTQFGVAYGYDSSMLQLDVTSNAIAIVAVGYASVFEREGSQWIEKQLS